MGAAVFRRALLRLLRDLRGGRLELVEDGRTTRLRPSRSALRARVEVRDPRAYAATLRGSTGWGESYVDGLWETDDLVALIRIAARDLPPLDRWRRRVASAWSGRLQRAAPPRSREHPHRRARQHLRPLRPRQRAVRALPRPRAMIYSCAYFPTGAALEEAQLGEARADLRRARADAPTTTCWRSAPAGAALAIHAASRHGCRVTTTTISREQHELRAEAGSRAAGLEDRVTVLIERLPRPARHATTSSSRSR